MNKKLLITTLALFIGLATFAQHSSSGIKFEEKASWKDIVKKAKAEKKLIFMDAYTTWCGPCKMLQARVFPDKQLGEYFNQNFVNAAIDMESDEGLRLSSIYEVRGYPTLFFIDPNNGKVVQSILGYTEIDQLLSTGKRVATKKKS
ncbi:thioredoxin family protein [Emticicia sp. 17c]|uniref:thioredoxin family protein n=1 Tax=Emticicia sp. 17c TaxID=3127704 RepID=UPI00301D8173